TLAQSIGDHLHPATGLAVASGQGDRLDSLAAQRLQGELQHQGLTLGGVTAGSLSLAVAGHSSHNPITTQRTGELRAPTNSRAPAPSLLRITRLDLPAPRLSSTRMGSPSGSPLVVNG